MKYLSWVITLPLTIAAVLFALSNRDVVSVDMAGLGYVLDIPAYLLVFLPFVAGFLVGGLIVWIRQGRHRRKCRQLLRENKALQAKLDQVKKDVTSIDDYEDADEPLLKLVDSSN